MTGYGIMTSMQGLEPSNEFLCSEPEVTGRLAFADGIRCAGKLRLMRRTRM
jgi:hypothetical protein